MVLYVHDAGNRRVRKDLVSGTDTDFLYGGWRVLEERTSGAGTLARQFVWGNYLDEALVMDVNGDDDVYCTSFTLQQDPDTRYYYLQNTLYSVYALTNADADVVEAYEYDPYGRHFLLTDGDSDGEVEFDATDNRASLGESLLDNPITFTGQRHDPETDLHYYKNRYYDSVRGRFISRDPIGTVDSLGFLYTYAKNRPTWYTDPQGQRVYVVTRNLAATASWYDEAALASLAVVGPWFPPAIAVLGTISHYRNNTWHCSLVIVPRCTDNEMATLDDLAKVDPNMTWDFQGDDHIHHPAADWEAEFSAELYERFEITSITDGDGSDDDVSALANSVHSNPFDVGGRNRYNCCDWVADVLGQAGLSYTNPNPKPFGPKPVPWYVLDGLVGWIVDR